MKNKIEENKRIYYLDIIKAIAMFFVVFLGTLPKNII